MSDRSGAASRALDMMQDSGARTAQAVRLTDDALARVTGAELQAATATLAQQDVSSNFGLNFSGMDGDTVLRCGCPGCLKAAGVTRDGHGDASGPRPLLADDVPDDTSSTVSLNVLEGQTIESQLNSPGDQDFFVFQGGEGTTYEFTLTPDDTSGMGPDLLFEVVDSEGNVVHSQDGGGFGSDEEYDFTPTADGTYYINVKGFTGVEVGGYSITGKLDDDAPDPNKSTPLDAIDWGTRVDTDGVTNSDGDEVIHVYFAKGPNSDPAAPPEVTPHPLTESNANSGWQQFEKDAAFVSFGLYENVINVEFVEVDSQEEADFIFGISPSAPVLLGAMSPPGEPSEGAAWFNNAGVGWDDKGLAQGGFGFITFTHELGHGMGMAHPHDNGGNSTVMNGVEDSGDSGEYNLNQGVHTVMTYNDGWPDGPFGKSPSDYYGYQGTLMALDLAVLQQKYGANMDYMTGDDVYTLPTSNDEGSAAAGAAATMYECIWDAGGKDTIAAGDAQNVNIDLREATLKYEIGGGGWVSYGYAPDGTTPVHGGFTIANGVKIENAIGGTGADTLIGSDYRNELDGGAGRDILFGHGGNDVLTGGAERDFLRGGRGDDRFHDGAGKDVLFGGKGADKFYFESIQRDRIRDLESGDQIILNPIDADTTRGGDQDFTFVTEFSGAAGEALLFYNSDRGITRLQLDTDGDGLANMVLELKGDQTGFDGFVN